MKARVLATVVLVAVASLALLAACTGAPAEGCPQRPDHRLASFNKKEDADSLIGLTRGEVEGRIGEPTSHRFSPEWQMSYRIRPAGLCMDSWYLVLKTDSQDVVIEAKVIKG
jgi:hypothetical protein